MTAKHSPAPFIAHRDNSPARIVAMDGDCIALVYLTARGSKKRDEAHLANMHLFAAAPALLLAAKLALHEMRHTVAPSDSFTDAVDALDAAIAQAEA